MTTTITIKYSCDFCQKDINTTGSSYGPLAITVTTPTFWSGSASGEFCSTECACKWIMGKALEKLSG